MLTVTLNLSALKPTHGVFCQCTLTINPGDMPTTLNSDTDVHTFKPFLSEEKNGFLNLSDKTKRISNQRNYNYMLLSSILLGIMTTFLPSPVSMGVSTVNFFASMEDPTLNWGWGRRLTKTENMPFVTLLDHWYKTQSKGITTATFPTEFDDDRRNLLETKTVLHKMSLLSMS